MTRALLAIVSVLTLAACSDVTAGEVIDKDHDSAWVQTVTSCSGKPVVCRTHTIPHPEQWKLRLKAGGETGWVNVSEDEYERYPIGRWYP